MKRQKERLHKVIVIGATPEGIAATNKLGELGIPVTLIDSEPDIDKKLSADEFKMLSGLTFNYAHRPGLIRILRNSAINTILPASVKSIKHTPQGFRVKIEQAQTFIDPDRCTLCGKCVELCPVSVGDGKAMIFNSRNSLPGRPFIDKRRKPLCQENCPLGVNAQGYIALAKAGRFQEALSLIRQNNVLPGICGRICTHPCEDACRRNELDEPVSIRAIKRFLADFESSNPDNIKAFETQIEQQIKTQIKKDEKIAIIGSGPAGIAAAADLAQKGYDVTVFEKEKKIGGLLRYGIGEHRLPRNILDQELSFIEKMGVKFIPDHPVDFVNDIKSLQEEFKAIIICTGTWYDRKLGVPGQDLNGVEGCLAFFQRRYWENITKVDKKVAVIGDGNSAFDLARTLVRLGADVTIVSWFPKDLIPADKDDIKEGLEEGIIIKDCTQVVKFIGKDGNFEKLECMLTRPGQPDENGIAWPIIQEDQDPFELCFDLAFVAVGQVGGFHQEDFKEICEITDRGFIKSDDFMHTSNPSIYAAGDAVTGASCVVEAMASGRQAAKTVYYDFYHKKELDLVSRPLERDFIEISQNLPTLKRPDMPELQASVRKETFDEVALGLNESQVLFEASRCLQCGVCSECFQCIEACGAINAVDHFQPQKSLSEHGGVVIVADPSLSPQIKGEDIIRAYGPKAARSNVNDMMVRGFAAAAKAMSLLSGTSHRQRGHGIAFSIPDPGLSDELRIGVFVCRCNDSLGWRDEFDQHLQDLFRSDPYIVHVETLNSACVQEGTASIIKTTLEKGITRIVLASCVCCPLNFVCSACTDQRSRLKKNLFTGTGITRSMVETCNVRGEILRLVEKDKNTAIERFKGLINRSISRSKKLKTLPAVDRNYNFTTAVIGLSNATINSALVLAESGHEVFLFGTKQRPLIEPVDHPNIHNFKNLYAKAVSGTTGDFQVFVESDEFSQVMRVGAVIIGEKARKQIEYIHQEGLPYYTVEPLIQEQGVPGVPFFYPCATSVPGLFLAEPAGINVSKLQTGAAAAVMAAAVMPRGPRQSKGFTVVVDENLCRGCGRCFHVCPYHAISLHQNSVNGWHAMVDETLCKGCGNCISVCPTSAADSPYRDRAYLEHALEELLV